MSEQAEILFEREGRLAIVTLNRPKAINALTIGMVREMTRALREWSRDDGVGVVLIRGAGPRGLCAGGDIVSIYQAARSGDPAPVEFWREEYALNLMIAEYSKPLVVLMHGVVMGGGVGVSAHASHRVVTETTSIAMPEVSIGFIPDVGGTYLLSRAPGELGTHLALTAGRAGAADAILLKLADFLAPQAQAESLPEILRDCADAPQVEAALAMIAASPGPAPLAGARAWIDQVYAAGAAEEIVRRLAARPEPAAQAALEQIGKNSPTSIKLTLRALRRARRFARLAPCLDMELTLASLCLRGHDFAEGIRAAVIDKDRKPQWSPARLEEVSDEWIDGVFAQSAF